MGRWNLEPRLKLGGETSDGADMGEVLTGEGAGFYVRQWMEIWQDMSHTRKFSQQMADTYIEAGAHGQNSSCGMI